MLINIILIILLIICAYTDLIYRKIYNFVTFPAIILGIIINIIYYGIYGLKQSVIGVIVGTFFLFVFFLLGGIGAGDIKFLAAVGSLKGWEFVIIGGLYGAVVGGIIGIIMLLVKKRFVKSIKKIYNFFVLLITLKTPVPIPSENSIFLPYGFFLSIGMLIHLIE